MQLTVEYGEEVDDLGPLSKFVIDLNPECTIAIIRISEVPPTTLAYTDLLSPHTA